MPAGVGARNQRGRDERSRNPSRLSSLNRRYSFTAGLAHLDRRGVAFDAVIAHAMPGFRLIRDGRPGPVVAGFAARRHHCGFHPHSGSILPQLAAEIGRRGHTRPALHFAPDDPIPPALLAAALDPRLAETGVALS